MSSYKIDLPSWASRVFFTAPSVDDVDEIVYNLSEKLKDLSPKWNGLGLMLKLPSADLAAIKSAPQSSSVKFRDMLEHWINSGEEKYRTWGFLADAVENANNTPLAVRIRKRKDYLKDSKVSLPLCELCDLLKNLTPQWKKFGSNLRIPIRVLDCIADPLTVKDCLRQTLTQWVKNSSEATFEVLIRAIESDIVSHRALAISISQSVEVLQLLHVPKKDKEREKIQEQLKKHIKELQGKNLSKPPSHIPAAISESKTKKQDKISQVEQHLEKMKKLPLAKKSPAVTQDSVTRTPIGAHGIQQKAGIAADDILQKRIVHAMQQSAEILAERILQKRIVIVTEVLKTHLSHFYNRLKEEFMIPEGIFDPDDKMRKKAESASILYIFCWKIVRRYPSKFFVVMDILREYPLLEQTVQEMAQEGVEGGLLKEKFGAIPLIEAGIMLRRSAPITHVKQALPALDSATAAPTLSSATHCPPPLEQEKIQEQPEKHIKKLQGKNLRKPPSRIPGSATHCPPPLATNTISTTTTFEPMANLDALPEGSLGPGHLSTVLTYLAEQGIISHWKIIGISLGLPYVDLVVIEKDHVEKEDRMIAMLNHWLTSGNASKQALINMLRRFK